jgi:cytosine/adenosine deaminase-related metal-dependent hydrolase
MKRIVLTIVGLALISGLGLGALFYVREQRQRAAADVAAVQRLDQDARVAGIIDQLGAAATTGAVAIVNVNVVDPVAGAIVPNQTVIVRDGRIEWVGVAGQAPALTGATVIDGGGRFLSPGLTDMHVHTEHMAQHVLRLAAGVTSVRDMDGFPWLLRTRDAIAAGRMIGATTYVAGTIIADRPLMGYAVVVRTPEQARQVVRNQAACGYSFIKVHNSLAEPLLDAVADEAHRLNLDLVGHVPHGISLQHAIQSAHMRTIEHLKGFLLDQTLLPSDEDYAPALAGAEVWLTPTLYTHIEFAHGAEARRLGADPRQRFNPRDRREDWFASVPQEGSNDAGNYERYVQTQAIVMARLLPLHPRWLVGTDAAGYSFNIAGFATLDELILLHQAGLSNVEVVRAATSEPAAAMHRPTEFGVVSPGVRADLVLLAANPLDNVTAYQTNLGVMARGRWYSRGSLDAALAGIARIYDEPILRAIAPAAASTIAGAVQARARAGYVFEDAALAAGAGAFRRHGAQTAAQLLRGLISAPATGFCAAELPG